jgi:hypothetical protein
LNVARVSVGLRFGIRDLKEASMSTKQQGS